MSWRKRQDQEENHYRHGDRQRVPRDWGVREATGQVRDDAVSAEDVSPSAHFTIHLRGQTDRPGIVMGSLN